MSLVRLSTVNRRLAIGLGLGSILLSVFWLSRGQDKAQRRVISLPSSKVLVAPAPGQPLTTNRFPTAVALSPNGRYLAVLNNSRLSPSKSR